MRVRFLATLLAAAAFTPAVALAQGVSVGGTVGVATELPAGVITYVEREDVPSVAVEERVVVGEALPASVELRAIPEYREYRYAVVNNQRVIVEPRTRKVIRIID